MASDSIVGTFYNGDVVSIVSGELVRVSSANRVVKAKADSAPHVTGLVGVSASGSVAPGGPLIVIGSAIGPRVLLEIGLTPVPGQTLYVSASTAGRATNVAPGIAVAIGVIENVNAYARDSSVIATIALGSGATGAQGPQGVAGAAGAQGTQGVAGAQGTQGVQGGSGLTLIETKTISGSPQTTNLLFNSGIAGDTDGRYLLQARYKNSSGGILEISLQPNSVSTNQQQQEFSAAGVSQTPGALTKIRLVQSSTLSWGHFEQLIDAKRRNGIPRIFYGGYSFSKAGANQAASNSGWWDDGDAAELTSLLLNFDQAGQLDVGSYVSLYKLP